MGERERAEYGIFRAAARLLRNPAPLDGLPVRDLREIESDAERRTEAEWERKHLLAAADRSVDLRGLRPKPVWRDNPNWEQEILFHLNDEHPSEIFRDGILPDNPRNTSLDDYVRNRRWTAFARASRWEGADGVANRGDFGRLYVYELRAPGGIDVHKTFHGKAGSAGDLAFPGGIAAKYIDVAHELIHDDLGNVIGVGEPMYPSDFDDL